MDGWDKLHKCPDSELSKNGPEVVSQEELGRARRRSHEKPEEPEGDRRSQEKAGAARRSQEEPGGARESQEAVI